MVRVANTSELCCEVDPETHSLPEEAPGVRAGGLPSSGKRLRGGVVTEFWLSSDAPCEGKQLQRSSPGRVYDLLAQVSEPMESTTQTLTVYTPGAGTLGSAVEIRPDSTVVTNIPELIGPD